MVRKGADLYEAHIILRDEGGFFSVIKPKRKLRKGKKKGTPSRKALKLHKKELEVRRQREVLARIRNTPEFGPLPYSVQIPPKEKLKPTEKQKFGKRSNLKYGDANPFKNVEVAYKKKR